MDMVAGAHDAAAAVAPELAVALGRLRRALRRRVRATFPEPALPQSHVEVLRLVQRMPGLRVQEVAAQLGLAPNTASTLVQHLARLGYIERGADARDRRVASLKLTPVAQLRLERWRDMRAAALDEALGALGEGDRARIAAALPALDRLATLLEERAR